MLLCFRSSWCGRRRTGFGAWAQLLAAAFVLLAPPCVALSQATAALPPNSVAELYQNFLHPPDDARPMVRWWWFGVAVQNPEILHELQQMKSDGIGGVELAFVYPQVLNDPARGFENLSFLSAKMLQSVTYAQSEARKLGLRVDVTLCSGWPYGGPSISLADAAGHLRTVEVPVANGVAQIAAPSIGNGESIVSVQIVNGPPGHLDAQTALLLKVQQGTVSIEPADQVRTVLFFISSHTRQQVKRAAVGAEGYVLDPFSQQAVAHYLNSVGTPLVGAFGDAPPYAIFSDSLEAYGADWTPDFPAEFLKRRGYDLIPHLAELIAGGSTQADAIRHDYGVTLTELVNQNYLTQMTDWAAAHHTRFRSQTYGTPAVSFSSQNLVSLAEGEGPQWRSFSPLRWATSANHIFGHEITSGETFTWLHSPVFRATPLDMKAEADIDLIMGENQFIFHGWPYSTPQAGEPGWSLYAAAALNDHNPWHPVMPYVTTYITRLTYLLRQGKPANQVAVLLPTDDAWASFSPGAVSITDDMKKLVPPTLVAAILSAGYNFDFIDAETIERVGIHHRILVLPPTYRVRQATLDALVSFVSRGGKVIAVGKLPSITPVGKPLRIPSVCEAGSNPQRACHPLFDVSLRGFVKGPSDLGVALQDAAPPDLRLSGADDTATGQLGFIRRKLPFADIYFLVNTSNRPIQTSADFSTEYTSAAQWDPDSTTMLHASALGQPIHLAPYESRVFVFSNESLAPTELPFTSPRELADLSSDWRLNFVSTGQSYEETTPTDWTAAPATLHYSGEVIYQHEVRDLHLPANARILLQIEGGKALPGMPDSVRMEETVASNAMPNPLITGTGPGMHAYYAPPIREAAIVAINHEVAGALWHPPYDIDVTKYLKPGNNLIEIHVYNTALNAWSALPPRNYAPLIAKYGDRFQMQDMDEVKPISSGLLGSVHLVSMEQQ